MFRAMSIFQRLVERFILGKIEGGGGSRDSKTLVLANWNPHFAAAMNVKNLQYSWVINVPLCCLKG